jgi:hypothetical protein
MMDFIMAPAIVGIVTLGIYKMFELFARRKERLAMIEKIGAVVDPSTLGGLFISPANTNKNAAFGTLKIACLLLGVGLGLLVGFFIGYYYFGDYGNNYSHDKSEAIGIIYGASTLLFGGLGLLIAFLVEIKHTKENA